MIAISRKNGSHKRLRYPVGIGFPYVFTKANGRKASFSRIDIPAFWLPFQDKGNGIVDIREYISNISPTYSRASVAWTRLSSGLWTQIASGQPRSYYNSIGQYAGFLSEPQITNNALHSRDLTNAAWTKTNITAAKTQTGIDGVINSCSLLTASAANGTCLQTVTQGSASKMFFAHVKRSIGVGEIDITLDGGTSWTNITSLLNSLGFVIVAINQTVTNQNFGFRIVTSGDAIVVDMCQQETGNTVSSPFPITTAALVRSPDILSYPTSPWYVDAAGALAGSFCPPIGIPPGGGSRDIIVIKDGPAADFHNIIFSFDGKFRDVTNDGGAPQADISTGNLFSSDAIGKWAFGYEINNIFVVLNNGAGTSDISATMPTPTEIIIGSGRAGGSSGAHKDLRYFKRRPSNTQLATLTV